MPGRNASSEQPPWPTIVFLHGVKERCNNLELVKRIGLPKFRACRDREPFHPYFPFYIVTPQCPEEQKWYERPRLEALDRLLDELEADPLVDIDQLYLTG
jgi:predicted peptidase